MYEITDAEFLNTFKVNAEHHFDIGGRFEILGNHTDHNHGLCIVGCASLKIYASVSKRQDSYVNINSLNSGRIAFSTNDIKVSFDEYVTSVGMAKGVALYLKDHGYKLGGFNAIFASDIPVGAGISSSAAFELIIGTIFNYLFNDGKIDKLLLAKAGQYAENKYFMKASGLLDQIGVSYGGINGIDFKNINRPKISHFPKALKGIHYVLVSNGGSHSDLSDLYSSIPGDMKTVANALGVEYLRDSSLKNLHEFVTIHPSYLKENEVKRAFHFYKENGRVHKALKALENDDLDTLLKCINESCESSRKYLKNTMVNNRYEGSIQEAIDDAKKYIGSGAIKVNGGGFVGTIICFVKDEDFANFMTKMNEKYGNKTLVEIGLNLDGACMRD